MRKFIYLFMFLFACTSYAQTEQISGQFRLIGTQEQPEADKVLTIDDNGDVGYSTTGVAKIEFEYDESMSNNTVLSDYFVYINTLGLTINASGEIRLPYEGVYEISILLNNSTFLQTTGSGSATISANLEGQATLAVLDRFNSERYFSSNFINLTDTDNTLKIIFRQTQPVSAVVGLATILIKKIH